MSKTSNVTVNLAPPLFLLFLTFLVLKLVGVIGWSWWWVTAPIWVPWLLAGLFLVGILFLWLAAIVLDR